MVYNVVITDDNAYAIAQRADPSVAKSDFQAAYAPFATYHCSLGFRTNCSSIPGTGPWCNMLDECAWNEGLGQCEDNPFFISWGVQHDHQLPPDPDTRIASGRCRGIHRQHVS